MRLWPFKKKPKKLTSLGKAKPVTITLDSNDTPRDRAIKICQVAGLVINQTMYERLEDMAKAFEFYQKHDTLSGKRKQTKTRSK